MNTEQLNKWLATEKRPAVRTLIRKLIAELELPDTFTSRAPLEYHGVKLSLPTMEGPDGVHYTILHLGHAELGQTVILSHHHRRVVEELFGLMSPILVQIVDMVISDGHIHKITLAGTKTDIGHNCVRRFSITEPRNFLAAVNKYRAAEEERKSRKPLSSPENDKLKKMFDLL